MPPWTASASRRTVGSSAGEVLPRSVSLASSCSLVGRGPVVQQRRRRATARARCRPSSVRPLNGPLPVATRIRAAARLDHRAGPAPDRASRCRAQLARVHQVAAFEHSEFQTCAIRPLARSIVDDVPLVGRDVADVAVGHDDQLAAADVRAARRASRASGRTSPVPASDRADLVPGRDHELVDVAVGAGGVHVPAVGIDRPASRS